MSDIVGSFQLPLGMTSSFAGFATVTSSFQLELPMGFSWEGFINRLVLTVDTPASLTFTPDTTAPL